MRQVATIRRLSRNRKIVLLEAALLLPLAWLLVRTLPFRFWSRWLGEPVAGEAEPGPSSGNDPRVREVSWAFMAISRGTGERFTCLMLAMAAQWMLDRHRISSSLVLGTRTERGADQRLVLQAHAWLRVGSQIMLGQHGGEYTAVSSFVRTYPWPAEDMTPP
ncbi:lasso peptide biosynthesis B2 protein [Halomonas kalidii]|uniref:Lasso peptide biosynthesis B2 protein n=1 Tax=Halomonas kalidii TaxID=3043293 RepID=A0ABT6VKH0_9GAMM|nr:lasso peptide biosynthesis B2 protein [Halomonas kalidii]MDI5934180.1 lasso peptide biosynthesis B2 protein [Halomonas kalidii]